jgi:hypothetical protein
MRPLHKSVLLSSAFALVGLLAILASSAALASGSIAEQSQTTKVACPTTGLPTGAVCYQTLSFGDGSAAAGGAATPATTTYIYPNVGFEEYYCVGSVCFDGFTIYMTAENWYNGSSAGTIYVSTSCSAAIPWSCQADSHGSFWDPGRGAETDWDNRNVDFYTEQCTPWLRIFVTPTGGVSRSGGGDSCP